MAVRIEKRGRFKEERADRGVAFVFEFEEPQPPMFLWFKEFSSRSDALNDIGMKSQREPP